MYYELLENTGTAPFEMDSIDISPLEFRSGYFIMAWDRNPNGYTRPQWYFSLGPDW